MGEKLSKDFNIAEEYRKLGSAVPSVGDHDFDVELEKQCFMSVNVIRNNPKKFLPHFEHIMSLKGAYGGKKGKKFIKWLKQLPDNEPLPPLNIDFDVVRACKANNE